MLNYIRYIAVKLITLWMNLGFEVKHALLKLRYGKEAVPQNELVDLFETDGSLARTITFTAALMSLATVIDKDMFDWSLTKDYAAFLRGEPNEIIVIFLISATDNKVMRKAILDELVKRGDIQLHQLNYYRPLIDRWLMGDNNECIS
jgi:hypothetical protein